MTDSTAIRRADLAEAATIIRNYAVIEEGHEDESVASRARAASEPSVSMMEAGDGVKRIYDDAADAMHQASEAVACDPSDLVINVTAFILTTRTAARVAVIREAAEFIAIQPSLGSPKEVATAILSLIDGSPVSTDEPTRKEHE